MKAMKPRWDNSNSRWEASVGSGKNRVWFRSRVEGEQGREIVEQKVQNHLHGPAPLIPNSLAEFIETTWWPRVKASCTPATLRGYKHILKKHVSRFYAMRIEDIRLETMQAWVNGIELSPKRIHNIFSLLGSILELARLTDRYHRLDHKLIALPEVVRTHHVDLTTAKVHKLLAAAAGTEMEGPVWVAAWLGLRRNEACGLKRPHVALHGATATVTLQDNRQPHGEAAKLKSKRAGESRSLEVPAAIAEKLLSFGPTDSLYLFNYKGKPIHPDRITKRMPVLCDRAGTDKMQFKELRAACRSNLKAAGVPEVDIMRILGHSSYRTSMLYQDDRASAQVDAFEKLLNL